jgi:hypothetical protein
VVPAGHLPLTGLELPAADGVPLGWQSWPQSELLAEVVVETPAPPEESELELEVVDSVAVPAEPAPAEAVDDGGATVLVAVAVWTLIVLWVEVVDEVPAAGVELVEALLPPQAAATSATRAAASTAASIRIDRIIDGAGTASGY